MALFSHRHYSWLASTFRDEVHKAKPSAFTQAYLSELISNFAQALSSDNPNNFDQERFFDNIYNPQEIRDDGPPDASKIKDHYRRHR